MTQPRRILWFAVFAAAVLLLPSRAAAQNYVTPTVKPTPPGQLIVVNNSPGADHFDPHVDSDLVSYTDQQAGAISTIRYHDLTAGTDNAVPSSFSGALDFLSDVRGTTIVFTRASATADIFTFDIGSLTLTEFFPQPSAQRFSAQIGDSTIVWQDFGSSQTASTIVAYDRASATTTVISPASAASLNQNPGISLDGGVVVWESCATLTSPCLTWKATRSAGGVWTAQQLVSQVGGAQSHPDTDGTIIAYGAEYMLNGQTVDKIVWQPAGGGTEQVLDTSSVMAAAGSDIAPRVGSGLISFAATPGNSSVPEIAIYNVATNTLYNLTADLAAAGLYPPGVDNTLSDISATPDGRVRVVWQANQNGQWNVYAYTFNLQVGDFSFSSISPLTISAGNSASTNVTVNPVNGLSSAVDLGVFGAPVGVMVPPPSPAQVTPSGGSPASSILNVSVSPALAPTSFTLTVTGTSGTLTHSATADVTVTATTPSIGNLIGNLLGQGCIDNGGIANALTSKLSAAQSAANIQTAINTLTALKNQINAQAGKHIATACNIGGVAFNPVTVLLLDVQGLIDSLRVSAIPDPITGYVVDMSGAGVAGAAVSIFDAGGSVVATATTDITGFYFFAIMSVLTPNANYTVAVTGLPPGFVTTPPPSPAFMWSGSGLMIGNFVLN